MKAFFKSTFFKIATIFALIAIHFLSFRAFSAEIKQATALPACQIAEEGYVQNKWKNVRIQIDEAVVAGAETLSELGTTLKKLVADNRCLPIPVTCAFAAEGPIAGSWAKHRILVENIAAFGSDTTAKLFDQLGQLKKMGVCE